MSKQNRISNLKGLFIKILIPLLIVIAIATIWTVKNSTDEKTIPQNDDAIQFPLNVTEALNLDELKSYGLPIMINFGSEFCPNCQKMAPDLEELNKEQQGKAIVLFVDVFKDQALVEGFPIRTIPTQVLITSDGKPYVPSDSFSTGIQMYSLQETDEHVFTTHEGLLDKNAMLTMLKEMGLAE